MSNAVRLFIYAMKERTPSKYFHSKTKILYRLIIQFYEIRLFQN